MTIAAALLGLAVVGFLGFHLGAEIARSMRWPEPLPRPYVCDRCLRTYRDTRTLSLHVRGEHPDTFDGG